MEKSLSRCFDFQPARDHDETRFSKKKWVKKDTRGGLRPQTLALLGARILTQGDEGSCGCADRSYSSGQKPADCLRAQ
jgi:hypothetical protein